MKTLLYKDCQQTDDGYDFVYEYAGNTYTISVTLPSTSNNVPQTLAEQYGLSMAPYLFNVEDFDAVQLESMRLSKQQQEFFEWFFLHGLAEHRYTNSIDPKKPIRIMSQTPSQDTATPLRLPDNSSDRYLIMIGGGKDSLVGLEIMERLKKDYTFFAVNINRPSTDVLQSIGQTDNLFNISLTITPRTGKGQKYSGHKPGSSFWAFASVIAAYSTGNGRVVVSNEHSANYPQIEVNGFPINHQFSKSFEFERRFNQYINTYLLDGYTYFSILRPLYEIQIAKIFAQHLVTKYQHTFISCNVTYEDGVWCKACAKCAFVFAVLAPFMEAKTITSIWGGNLFETEAICRHLYDLASDNVSPLECVGTPFETRIALCLANERGLLETAHESYKPLLQQLAASMNQDEVETILKSYEENGIPSDIKDDVQQVIQEMLRDK